jgi:cell division protein FtsL
MDVSITRFQATGRFRKSLPKRLIASRAVVPVIVLGALMVFACLHIWQRNYVLELEKQNGQLEGEALRLNDLIKKTNREITDLTRVSRIEQLAFEKFGLQRTSAENIFTIVVEKPEVKREGLDNVIHSLRKLAGNLPIVTESRADTLTVFDTDGH